MSFWIILSWVFVLVLTAINVVIFLKLKQASEGMMKSMFPNAKNMNEAMAGMQQMMSGFPRILIAWFAMLFVSIAITPYRFHRMQQRAE